MKVTYQGIKRVPSANVSLEPSLLPESPYRGSFMGAERERVSVTLSFISTNSGALRENKAVPHGALKVEVPQPGYLL